jgi:hypothetical protein
MNADVWIVVPNWEKFQHYKDRSPPWIKLYTELAHKDEWLALSGFARGVLVTIWIEYAQSQGRVRSSAVHRQIRSRYTAGTLEALNHAGFIEFSASRPLAHRYQDASPEREVLRTSLRERASARARTGGSREHAEPNSRAPNVTAYQAAESMTRNVGWQFPLAAYRDELARFHLDDRERDLLEALWQQLGEDDW